MKIQKEMIYGQKFFLKNDSEINYLKEECYDYINNEESEINENLYDILSKDEDLYYNIHQIINNSKLEE